MIEKTRCLGIKRHQRDNFYLHEIEKTISQNSASMNLAFMIMFLLTQRLFKAMIVQSDNCSKRKLFKATNVQRNNCSRHKFENDHQKHLD